MALQKVNTDAINQMATAISTTNANLNSAFSDLYTDGKNMDAHWNSSAGNAATTLMYSLFKGNEARSAVLENYIVFLRQYVTQGYIAAEEQNTKLADQFL